MSVVRNLLRQVKNICHEVSRGRRQITVLFVLTFLVNSVSANVEGLLSPAKGRNLFEVLNELNSNGYKIVFSSSQVTESMLISREPTHSTGIVLLEQLLSEFDLQIQKGPNDSYIVKKEQKPQSLAIVGNLFSTMSVPIDNIEVTLTPRDNRDQSITLVTDQEGKFSAAMPVFGDYLLQVNADGFERVEKRIRVGGSSQDTFVSVLLTPEILPIEHIVVSTNQYDINYANSFEQQFMQQQDIERLSHLASDINRALAHVPGISGGDYSAKLNVRGGVSDENLFMLDGMPLYDPFHLKESGSFFTIVDAFTIGSAQIITGGAPVEFGEHLSGVVNLSSKNWEPQLNNALGINFLHAKVRASGLFNDNEDNNWLVSARHGFMRVIGAASDVELDNYNPQYSDFFAKATFALSDDTQMTWHSMATLDQGTCFNNCIEDHSGRDFNQYHWLTTETDWSENLQSKTLLGHGNLEYTRNGTEQNAQRIHFLDDELKWHFSLLKQDWRYRYSDEHLFKAGLELKHQSADYEYQIYLQHYNPFLPLESNQEVIASELFHKVSGTSYSGYLAQTSKLTQQLTAELGIRWDKQNYSDEQQVSPRLNFDYRFDSKSNLKLSYGYYNQAQGIHQLLVEDSRTDFSKAQKVRQVNLSYQNGQSDLLGYKVSLYHKAYESLLPRFESQFGDDSYIYEGRLDRVLLKPSEAYARGLELGLSGRVGERFSWKLGYSYSQTEERINGEWLDRKWDQQHSVNALLNFELSDSCNANMVTNYHSGWRYTPVSANQNSANDDPSQPFFIKGKQYSARYPSFLSVDARVGCEYKVENSRLRLFFEVVNLFNRRNVIAETDHIPEYARDGSLRSVIRDDESFIPRIPSLGIIWEF